MHHKESAKAVPVGPLPEHLGLARSEAKVQWAIAPNGNGFWLISDYGLARRVLADPRFSRSEAAGLKAPKLTAHNPAPDAIISLEGAAHSRMRQMVASAFTERRMAKLEPFVVRMVEDLLDELDAQNPPADFVSHVSAPLPFATLCRLLGVPPGDREIFGSWVNVLFRLVGDTAVSRQASVGLARYMTRLVAEKRREPADDLISHVIRSSGGNGDKITNRELVTLCLGLLMAGYDSTVDQITNCVFMLLLDQSLMRALSRNPELVNRVTEELLRLNPAPYVTFPRMAIDRVPVGGIVIEPGQLVVVFIMRANRDESTFTSGDEAALDLAMPTHLTFGHGMHRCLGAPLARLQLVALLRALSIRFPRLHVADDVSSLDWKTEMATRGLSRMLVSW
jgi:cytochrome P450